jgi:hypothetical protein
MCPRRCPKGPAFAAECGVPGGRGGGRHAAAIRHRYGLKNTLFLSSCERVRGVDDTRRSSFGSADMASISTPCRRGRAPARWPPGSTQRAFRPRCGAIETQRRWPCHAARFRRAKRLFRRIVPHDEVGAVVLPAFRCAAIAPPRSGPDQGPIGSLIRARQGRYRPRLRARRRHRRRGRSAAALRSYLSLFIVLCVGAAERVFAKRKRVPDCMRVPTMRIVGRGDFLLSA